MGWFYRLFIRFLRVFVHLYFVEVRASGMDRIPETGPVILAANHPTSILDAILLAMHTRRQIHFLAASRLFRNRFLARLLYSLGAIPVYRAHEVTNHGSQNEAAFRKAHELFERGGCLGIFPEGGNSPVHGQVAQLRKGCARVALSAEGNNDYSLGLTIVPIGLNYESRELFMSRVLIRFGRPIRVADYGQAYASDPEAAITSLTEELQSSLRRQAMHEEDRQVAELADDLSEALGYQPIAPQATPSEDGQSRGFIKRWLWRLLDWYRPDTGATYSALESRVQSRQEISDILNRSADADPEGVAALRKQLDRYKDHLEQTQMSQTLKSSLDEPVRQRLIRLRMTIYALLVAPVALFGFVHNVIPYLLTAYLPRLIREEPTRAFGYFGVGVLAFSAAYGAFGFWLWYSAEMSLRWIMVYLAVLPPTGFVTLGYRRNIILYRRMILVRTFFWNDEELVQLLRRERQAVIERFEALSGHEQTP